MVELWIVLVYIRCVRTRFISDSKPDVIRVPYDSIKAFDKADDLPRQMRYHYWMCTRRGCKWPNTEPDEDGTQTIEEACHKCDQPHGENQWYRMDGMISILPLPSFPRNPPGQPNLTQNGKLTTP